jgi:hypothetical protein
MHGSADGYSDYQQQCLVHPGPGRFEDGGNGHTAGICQSFEIYHLFAKRDDKSNTEYAACYTGKNHKDGAEIGFVQDE